MPIQENCRLLKSDKLNDFAYSFILEAPGIAAAITTPDQFVHIKCGDKHFLRRPISICGWDETTVRVVFEVRGEGTAWLAERSEGDILDVLGPLGKGFTMEPDKKYLLVGGGIGVPPMLGCAGYAPGRCDGVLGFRDSAHALLIEDFKAVCPTVALATEDGSLGEKGFVTGPMETLLKSGGYAGVLCCGPKAMLKAVVALAERYGVPCQVSLEERMACAVGACLGCAVLMADGSMKHVCKDGPVFNASEVDWNG